MADFPDTIPTFRTNVNLPQEAYDAGKQTTIYAEDFNTIRAEVVAITEAIGVQLENLYPIGCIIEFGDATTTPETRGMLGTWARHCEGYAHVGYKSGDTEFGTVNGTVGAKTHTLITAEMPSHTHTQDAHTHTQNAHNHSQFNYNVSGTASGWSRVPTAGASGDGFNNMGTVNTTATNQNTTATNQNTGGGGAHNNIQPSVVVVCWIRTA